MYCRQDLALEDVPAREPHARARCPAGPAPRASMIAAGRLLQKRPIDSTTTRPTSSRRVSQVPSRNRCGTYWANTLIVCTPGGRDARVVHRLEVELVPGARRAARPSLAARWWSRHSDFRERRVHLAGVVRLAGAGPGREVGQLGEASCSPSTVTPSIGIPRTWAAQAASAPPSSSAEGPVRVGVGDDLRRAGSARPTPARRPRRAESARPARRPPPSPPPRARRRRAGTTPSPCPLRRSPRFPPARPSAPRRGG